MRAYVKADLGTVSTNVTQMFESYIPDMTQKKTHWHREFEK